MSKVITVMKTVMKAVLKLAPGDGINGRAMLAPLRASMPNEGQRHTHQDGVLPEIGSNGTERFRCDWIDTSNTSY